MIAPALVRRYGKGTDSDATDAMVVTASALDRRRGGADDNDAQARHLVAAPLTAGSHSPGVNPPGRRKEDDHNIVSTSRATGVRRLTPTECERLMSWPDGWTLPGSDSRRYAACGDGVVSNVAEWIGLGIAREDGGRGMVRP